MSHQPKTIYLADYQPSDYAIDHVDLCVRLAPEATFVEAHIRFRRLVEAQVPLRLNGVGLTLIAIDAPHYAVEEDGLMITDVPEVFDLKTTVQINPQANTALQGLYLSKGIFCTQCEAEAFRRITYFLDRPDVLTTYTVKIIANKMQYPILLSNGNLIEQGDLPDNQHYAVWHDPHKKPCYLFALVAGDLAHIASNFTTCSGKEVSLKIYAKEKVIDQCDHAMASLKKAMAWDEEKYGREYDLEVFHIVAIDDFIFGAMENKSLNIFNAKYILSKPESATDQNRMDITTVVAHEYFHNWSGNRVTCRDWFQLSLKEGFTVFREQSFDEDMHSFVAHRIRKVQDLRNRQFEEDAGPMAHPVRPDHYMTIDNFYTATVYNKGGEVIRMIKTLLGEQTYREGCDDYFARYDGQAVTCDDFVASMQAVSGYDFTQFKRWYSQAGTPQVTITGDYHQDSHQYRMVVKQSHAQPMVIPIKMALLDAQGQEQALGLSQDVLLVTQSEEVFVFENITSPVIPSLLREFSAPIQLHYDYTDAALIFLMRHDQDGFNRWEAAQRVASRLILADAFPEALFAEYMTVLKEILSTQFEDPYFQAELLTLPSESSLAALMPMIDVDKIVQSRQALLLRLSSELYVDFLGRWADCLASDDPGVRALKHACLVYVGQQERSHGLLKELVGKSLGDNMTDTLSALSVLANQDVIERVEALSLFEDYWREDSLVMNKWFSLQAMSCLPSTLQTVKSLAEQAYFDIKNPNNVYALIGAFGHNMAAFHVKDGAGYRFVADKVAELNRINPNVAARVIEPLLSWRRYDRHRQGLMRHELERLAAMDDVSTNLYECVSQSLENNLV